MSHTKTLRPLSSIYFRREDVKIAVPLLLGGKMTDAYIWSDEVNRYQRLKYASDGLVIDSVATQETRRDLAFSSPLVMKSRGKLLVRVIRTERESVDGFVMDTYNIDYRPFENLDDVELGNAYLLGNGLAAHLAHQLGYIPHVNSGEDQMLEMVVSFNHFLGENDLKPFSAKTSRKEEPLEYVLTNPLVHTNLYLVSEILDATPLTEDRLQYLNEIEMVKLRRQG